MSPPVLKPSVPIPIDDKILIDVISKAKDFALMHGSAMRSKSEYSPDSLQFAPFILTPSSFPRNEFKKAIEIQPILNELMHNVAMDSEFLKSTLRSTVEVDEFTGGLFKIYEKVLEEGISQRTPSLGLFRSDYLANYLEDNVIKQVEFNTIASSFGGIATQFQPIHSYVLHEMDHGDKIKDLPENLALSGLCSGMIEAWKLLKKPSSVILFLIEDVSYNICDQRFHEFYIRTNHPEVKVIRRTLTDVSKRGKLGPNGELIVDNLEVTVIYFRAGYEPGHYHSQSEWDARLMMERSLAVKCPSINYHLAGTKKVQQALAKPGVLNKFLTDAKKIEAVSEIFTGLYSLDKDEQGEASIKLALSNPEKYVLKPQREGGGNNVYGSDIPDALNKMDDNERSAWILMERIFPPISRGYMIRPGGPVPPPIVDLVSELGIFGVLLADGKNIIINQQVGHMLRTKLATANEGGVAAGLGALDSPYLID